MNAAWWLRPTLLVAAVLGIVGLVSLPPDPDMSAGSEPSVSATVYKLADLDSPNLSGKPAIATMPAVAMATASAPARRLTTGTTVADTSLPVPAPSTVLAVPGPGGTSIEGRCTQYETLLTDLAPPGGWDVAKMSRTGWRETRCDPSLRSTTSDSGLLQINDINHPFLRTALGEWVDRWTLLDPVQNIRAAAALCTYWQRAGEGCYHAWRGGA